MKEKLQEYALLAEIISAVCIVLSLVFVGVQIKQGTEETASNTAAIRGQVRESMLSADLNILHYMGENPILWGAPGTNNEVINFDPYDGVSSDEGIIFSWYEMMVRTRENYWAQYSNGLLDEETYKSYRDTLVSNIHSQKWMRELWENNTSKIRSESFVNEINSALTKLE